MSTGEWRMPRSERFLLFVMGFMMTEMECKRTICEIERAWKSDKISYDNLQSYISLRLGKEQNAADNRKLLNKVIIFVFFAQLWELLRNAIWFCYLKNKGANSEYDSNNELQSSTESK